jgi:hypothetical protein
MVTVLRKDPRHPGSDCTVSVWSLQADEREVVVVRPPPDPRPQEGLDDPAAAPSQPVKGDPTIAPGELGPDPVLDAYAPGCFGGDLLACDDLFFESPPMSASEEYVATCGIRVEQFAVMACTELE